MDSTETSDENEESSFTSSDFAASFTSTSQRKKREIVDANLSASLDMAKLSHRRAALVLTPAIQNLDHDPSDFQCSYSSIREQRLQHGEKIGNIFER